MILVDVNVLIYAHREEVDRHDEYGRWLEEQGNAETAFGISDLVLSGFIRIVTHPRIFKTPSPLPDALAFANALRALPNAVPVSPGERHWGIFAGLCEATGARGNLIPDAYLAALAIESGAEWITRDRDYSRFPGLRWRSPLAG